MAVLLLTFTASAFASGCNSPVQTKTITVTTVAETPVISWLDIPTYYQMSEKVETETGEVFAIALPRNPRLGLVWTVTHDNSCLELIESSYVWFGIDFMDDRGNQYFIFKAIDSGTTQVEFLYSHTILGSSVRDEKTFEVSIR
ncbi:MAG: protease inhibitor I42 family protein [Dehalococcoidales bacterium]|nr:protease inhibitor I42 family protein [Dehalococcoidales bacterium]MDD3264359.1 protease inhibitor I42 family protein [Dehalococcoidales bacterium]MDD4322125.1 protease inhibitor I42 family protein [Dehalococcoidales bacterium]MDD4793695.1 protease inhibitor I42 family protein [Dehalococcoidales bacterium]MDD5122017.1 protease inhibitor I42 family protein [Dehalococcoidales bacterium]